VTRSNLACNCTHFEHASHEGQRKSLKSGAPGEIRTPDLLLRRTCRTKNQQLRRTATNCDGLLQMPLQQGFPAMPRHSVALGRVWWWAQNWAQSPRCCFAIATSPIHRQPIPAVPSCPPWHPGDGGGISIPPHIFFYFLRHAARWRLDAAPVSVRVPVNAL
jgi:hypothetical protein